MGQFSPRNPRFKERVEGKLKGQAFMKHIGFRIVDISAGSVTGELDLEAIHKQQFGILHGGVVSTVADIVAGFSAYTLAPADKDVVTGEIKISYFRPGKGTKVRAVGKVVKPGRNICFVESEVYAIGEVEKLIAKATTTMVFIDKVQYQPTN